MKKVYMAPETVVVQFLDGDELCGGLTGWSAGNESDGSKDSSGNTDQKTDKDPAWGIAGAKNFDAWSAWDE